MDEYENVLHSHSRLERILSIPKSNVLVDAKFRDLFPLSSVEPFTYNGVRYCLVPTLLFVNKNGVFKQYER